MPECFRSTARPEHSAATGKNVLHMSSTESSIVSLIYPLLFMTRSSLCVISFTLSTEGKEMNEMKCSTPWNIW